VTRVLPLSHAAALALAAAACTADPPPTCPGEKVAAFEFAGARTTAADPLLAGLDPVSGVTDCGTPLAYPAAVSFSGTLSAGTGSTGALCRVSGPILHGSRSGDRWTVEESTDGAVLAACGPTCGATLRVVVEGDVVLDPGGVPTAFEGALVEVLTPSAGDCGGCALPCAGRYALTGTPEAR
jgi:hypothetical protein